jgi:hydroxyacylglutathione hydrolase
LLNNLDKVSKERKVVIHCQGGDRAAIGYSLLAANGYENVVNYSASINEWIKQGNPVVS